MESIKALAYEIDQDRRDKNLDRYGDSLHQSIAKLDYEDAVEEGLSKILGVCHVKAYGDLYLESFSGWEWPNKVSKLGGLSREKKKAIQGA